MIFFVVTRKRLFIFCTFFTRQDQIPAWLFSKSKIKISQLKKQNITTQTTCNIIFTIFLP